MVVGRDAGQICQRPLVVIRITQSRILIYVFVFSEYQITVKKNFNRGDTVSITAGIRSRELCQAPINASVILSLAGVVGERLSFSNLQMKMQRRLRPDSNARLEATYCHSLIRRCALVSAATPANSQM